jgi:hypothetical protein
MSSGNLLQSLMQYPKDIINDEMVELVAPYLEMPDYNIETARKVRSHLNNIRVLPSSPTVVLLQQGELEEFCNVFKLIFLARCVVMWLAYVPGRNQCLFSLVLIKKFYHSK